MNLWKSVAGCALTVVFVCGVSLADMVQLQDGSKVNGKIKSITDGKLEITTSFAGDLAIDMGQVVGVSSDTPIFVQFQSGNRLLGTVGNEGGAMVVKTVDGTMSIKPGAVVGAWREGDTHPLTTPPVDPNATRQWKYEVALDLSGKTGNTEKTRFGGSFTATLKSDVDQLKVYGRAATAKEEGEKTEDELIGGMDYEANFTKRQSWYSRIELESDDIEELELRTTAALGYGYYFLREPTHVLRARAGALYRHESYQRGKEDESTPGVDLSLHHLVHIKEWSKLVTDVTYTPSVEDARNYRIYHESALDIPLAAEQWKLRLGIANEYNSLPAEDKDRLDTSYFARIVVDF